MQFSVSSFFLFLFCKKTPWKNSLYFFSKKVSLFFNSSFKSSSWNTVLMSRWFYIFSKDSHLKKFFILCKNNLGHCSVPASKFFSFFFSLFIFLLGKIPSRKNFLHFQNKFFPTFWDDYWSSYKGKKSLTHHDDCWLNRQIKIFLITSHDCWLSEK